jgi:hypothetical protein
MNNQRQENGVLAGPLIFTVPAYGYPFSLPAYAAAFWRGCHRSIRRRTEW